MRTLSLYVFKIKLLFVIPVNFDISRKHGGGPVPIWLPQLQKQGATDLTTDLPPFELITAGRRKDPHSLAHLIEVPDSRQLEWSKTLQK